MTPAERIALVKGLHGQPRPMRELLMERVTDDVEWFAAGPPDVFPWAGMWRGRDGLEQRFSAISEHLAYSRFEPRQFIADDEHVVMIAFGAGTARSTGMPFSGDIVRIFTFRGDRISRVRTFYDTAAYAAAMRPASR